MIYPPIHVQTQQHTARSQIGNLLITSPPLTIRPPTGVNKWCNG